MEFNYQSWKVMENLSSSFRKFFFRLQRHLIFGVFSTELGQKIPFFESGS